MRMPHHRGTAEDRDYRKARILELHEQGCTVDAISERLGISRSRVGHFLKSVGLKRNNWDGAAP